MDLINHVLEEKEMQQNKDKNSDKAFDKQELIKQKQNDKKEAFEFIDATALELAKNPKALKSYLDMASRIGRYSVGNSLLIFSQLPDATELKDFDSWKEQGVSIMKGAKGITIIEPGDEYVKEDGTTGISYTTKKVFDVSQTNREKRPDKNENVHTREKLCALIKDLPVTVAVTNDLPDGLDAFYDRDKDILGIRGGLETDNIFWSLAKEVSHFYFDNENYVRQESDMTAAACGYMICSRYGIDGQGVFSDGLFTPEEKEDAKAIRAKLANIRDVTANVFAKMDAQLSKDFRVKKETVKETR